MRAARGPVGAEASPGTPATIWDLSYTPLTPAGADCWPSPHLPIRAPPNKFTSLETEVHNVEFMEASSEGGEGFYHIVHSKGFQSSSCWSARPPPDPPPTSLFPWGSASTLLAEANTFQFSPQAANALPFVSIPGQKKKKKKKKRAAGCRLHWVSCSELGNYALLYVNESANYQACYLDLSKLFLRVKQLAPGHKSGLKPILPS